VRTIQRNDYAKNTKERIFLICEDITISLIVKRKVIQSFIFLNKNADLTILKCSYKMSEDARFKEKLNKYQY